MGTLLDSYKQLDYIGQGARSSILLVRDDRDGQCYALKRVYRRDSQDIRFVEQVEAEHEIARQFTHPALRRSLQLHRVRKWLRTVEVQLLMEYFPGQDLEHFQTTVDLAGMVRIFQQVAGGLHALHCMGYVHADIKPNNILVNPETLEVRIIDFGQSCRIGSIKERIQGTPDYIAPEQVHRLPLDQRTDVFNLGATMYRMLTGKPWLTLLPGEQLRPGQKLDPRYDWRAKAPHELNPQVTPALSRLVMDCCSESPQARPSDMPHVVRRLQMGMPRASDAAPARPEAGARVSMI